MLEREAEQHWVSAHVFTAHPLDLALRQLLPGVCEDLRQRGAADGFFFWQSGPHLRLRVRARTAEAVPEVRAALAGQAAMFFQLQPSEPTMTESQYRVLAERFSAMEPGSEPGTLAPNDSLAFVDYRPEHAKYGRGAALRAAEQCFGECSELALDAIVAGWDQSRRLAHCFALLAGSLGPQGPAMSRAAPAITEQYRQRRESLLPVARSARAALAGDPPGGPDAPVTDPAAAGSPPSCGRWISPPSRSACPAI
ncbi:hypothetical protein GXW82_15410 [Streptacidiphilus sp. 4-A2]|nr:hypothetical protein [Streptacidiphilus sp. 4-A2]